MAKSASKQTKPKVGYFIQSRGPGGMVKFEKVYVYGPTRRSNEGIVGHDLRMRPMRLGPGNYTFVGSPNDVEWTRPASSPTTKSHARIKKKSSRDKASPLAPPRSKAATVIVYSRPSGYWYAQARDAATGVHIMDASGYSRENVLRELQSKFAMIGVTIKSITEEDPYAAEYSSTQPYATKKSAAQLEHEINEALTKKAAAKLEHEINAALSRRGA